MDSSAGSHLASILGFLFLMLFLVGVALGAGLCYLLPFLWHHVVISFA